ncbi:hypothetical protein, partial [Yersinia pestis]
MFLVLLCICAALMLL